MTVRRILSLMNLLKLWINLAILSGLKKEFSRAVIVFLDNRNYFFSIKILIRIKRSAYL